LFDLAMQIETDNYEGTWEHLGGRRREYLDAIVQLHIVLDLRPFEVSPVDAVGEMPAWEQQPASYRHATELRRELLLGLQSY
jgi:hypothetical protein